MSLKFGVVGSAHWTREMHAPNIQASPHAELVGIWARAHEKASGIAGELGIAAFERYEALLDAVDAVSIAVRPEAQPDLAIQAAKAGKHLILEKPIALSVTDAERVVDAISDANTASLVFFTRRFIPEIAEELETLKRSNWSDVTVRLHGSIMTAGSPFSQSVWRAEPGAALWDIGPHVFAILNYVLGPPVSVERVQARDQYSVVRSHYANGAVAEISLTLHADGEDVADVFHFKSGDQEYVMSSPTPASRQAAFRHAVEQLATMAAANEQHHPCDARFGLEVVRSIAMAK